MKIYIFYEDIQEFELFNGIYEWINNSIQNENKQKGEINIIFCSDDYLLKMNKDHLNHDYFTDIITFDYCEKDLVSGDLFISTDRVGENAKKFNVEFNAELNRVIIHGVLHLIGYNDKTDEEQKEMTEKENFYLNRIKDWI